MISFCLTILISIKNYVKLSHAESKHLFLWTEFPVSLSNLIGLLPGLLCSKAYLYLGG